MVVEHQQLTETISIPERGSMACDHDQESPTKPKIRMTRLLLPYWRLLAIAFVALLVEGAADLLEPWPLKIIFDNVIGSKQMPAGLARIVEATVGLDKFAVLRFAVFAVVAIAIVGAISTYIEKYLTTK